MPLALLIAAASFAPVDPPADAVPPLSDADRAAIAEAEALGALIVPLSQTDARLDVSYHLGGVTLTPAHLDALAPLADRLHELNLRGTAFDDATSPRLAPLTELRRLHLEGTKITDDGLAAVGGLSRLEYLNLYGTAVTDAGLPALEGLSELRSLYLWDTAVTADGVVRLTRALPELEVVGVPLPPAPRRPLVAPRPKPRETP